MGTLGGDGSWPPDGGKPEGLPGLPPEWGSIVIPDDPAALAEEAAAVRREMRREIRQRTWRRRASRLTGSGNGPLSALRVPLLIMSLAISAALVSLLVLIWPSSSRQSAAPIDRARTAPGPSGRTVPALELVNPTGKAVALRGLLPAVILLTEGCSCADLVMATAHAAPAGVSVVLVDRQVPADQVPETVAGRVHALGDPAGELRSSLAVSAAGAGADLLLVAAGGEVIAVRSGITEIDGISADLARMASPRPPGATDSAAPSGR